MQMSSSTNLSQVPGIRKQGGFTLAELAIVLVIIVLLGTVMFKFVNPGSKAKAVAMKTDIEQIASGLIRLKNDTGCHIKRFDGLWDNAQNTAANTYCGTAVNGGSWKGPYVERFQVDSTDGTAIVNKLISGMKYAIAREAGGIGQRYYIRASSVPDEIIEEAYQACTGVSGAANNFNNGKCRGDTSAAAETGTFDILYDETR